MITPRFNCSQTPESVIVSIYCPSVRAADIEIHVDETLFTVYINPYFLRLNFSNALVEDDSSSAKYDPSTGYLVVTLTKAVHGQEFGDLDLLAKLLAPRPKAAPPVIEVIESKTEPTTDFDELVAKTSTLSLEQGEILQATDDDWQLPQNAPEEFPLDTLLERRYGFLDTHTGYFRHVMHTENEVNELGAQAETCTVRERRRLRIEHEDQKWDPEYYMADFADDDYIQELIRWENPLSRSDELIVYTEEETAQIMCLPRKEYIPTSLQTHQLYLTLLTLLFSYAYDTRTTQRDPTPESAWTLCSLTPAFSALDPPDYPLHRDQITIPPSFTDIELSETLASSYRRSLAFPLHRSFALAEACRKDIAAMLLNGNRTVCRCLLEMKKILDHHEVYYIYSKIWVDDFCVWIQASASNDVLHRLGHQLAELRIEKKLIGWELEQFEAATAAASNRELDSDDESDSGGSF